MSGKPPGSTTAVRRTGSAVPAVANKTYSEYKIFAEAYELDVIYTINNDLEKLADEEKQAEMSYMQRH